MDIGILGLGPVGSSFLNVVPNYGHRVVAYDINPDKMTNLPEDAIPARNEEEVGARSDLLLACTDMLSGSAVTKAVSAMRDGRVVCDDFSAKTPAYNAYKAANRELPYYSIHTMFAPSLGFDGQLIVEIPVMYCTDDDGQENPYIAEFREVLTREGAKIKRIWSVRDHDERMGRIQGAVSAAGICTARTFAELGVNPLEDGNIYHGNELDRANFWMSLRAIGPEGSSNPTVYGLIALMNPFSFANISEYYTQLMNLVDGDKKQVDEMLEEAVVGLGSERVRQGAKTWDRCFGPMGDFGNSYSSHLATACHWSRGSPLEIFAETPSPPYRMRERMALKALSMYPRCVENMSRGDTHDREFLDTVGKYMQWIGRDADEVEANRQIGWERIRMFEEEFFTPVREAFPDEIKRAPAESGAMIKKLMQA